MRKFLYHAREFIYQLLRVDAIRFFVAAIRYLWYVGVLRRMKTFNPDTGDLAVNAVHHNLVGLRSFYDLAINRSHLLLYPLSAIRMSKSSPILAIGPRSEGELLNFRALGFRNVQALDLISYSPWVRLGDMHAMPYADNSFAVVVLGWVLIYSANRQKAVQEILRVVRNGGIVAIGSEFRSATREELSQRKGYEVCDDKGLNSVDAILKLFENHVDRVFFRQDLPEGPPPEKWNLLVLFSVKK